MRKLVRIFMTVVAGMMAFSCATDTTDDLGVNLGKGQKTVISVSLEESRTYLGTLADGKYPMYWSADDKISVNGVESEPAVISEANGAVASFTVNGVEKPFCIAYPAAPKGQVLFAENQVHSVNNSFSDGVSTMYGYGEKSANVTLNHLTGILKIGITGSDNTTLKYAQISTVDRTPIAGAFNLDFAKGVVTPTADAKSVINYSFEGDESDDIGGLSSTPTYIYVAVPAGIYDELYVTLCDTKGGVMYATVLAGEESTAGPLEAGKVREFTNTIEYTPAANNVTVIKNYDDLVKFKAAAEAATATAPLTTKVVLANDIKILDDTNTNAWESIDGVNFTGTFNGNGYAIDGLTAPLFNTTSASIRGLHLTNVAINEKSETNIGALARIIENTGDTVIEHCSVSGSITVEFENCSSEIAVGGFIGRHRTTVADHLVNRAKITVKGKGYSKPIYIGGVIAASTGSVRNSVNLGQISVENIESSEGGTLAIGGVVRYAKVENCINGSADDKTGLAGKIDINGSFGAAVVVAGIVENLASTMTNSYNYGDISYGGSSTNYIQLSGLVRTGSSSITISDSSNYGEITASGSSDTQLFLGGFMARIIQTSNFQNCQNHGALKVEATANVPEVYIGGMVGGANYGAGVANITKCSNSGDITALTPLADKVCLGGVCGMVEYGQINMQREDSTKPSSNSGDIKYSATNDGATVHIGGAVGFHTTSVEEVSKNSTFISAFFTNEGDITVEGECLTTSVGGVVGRSEYAYSKNSFYYSFNSSENKGTLTVSATVNGDCAIGGLNGYKTNTYSSASGNLVNRGKLVFTGTISGGRLLLGGYIGATSGTSTSGNGYTIYNFGDIESTGTVDAAKNNYVGGVAGFIYKATQKGCHCYCKIKAVGVKYVGMLTGTPYATNVAYSNSSLGGWIWDEDNQGDYVKLTESDYKTLIYGSGNSETAAGNCTFLAAEPEL